MEIPGVKKYSNDNFFLNSINDPIRSAYKSDTKATERDNKPMGRFEADLISLLPLILSLLTHDYLSLR